MEENAQNTSLLGAVKGLWNKFAVPELKQIVTGPRKVLAGLVTSAGNIFNVGLFDVVYFCVVILLLVFGLIVHYSASYTTLKQGMFAVAGILVMLLLSQIKVSVFKELSSFAMAIATVFLVLVFTRSDYMGTHRWFYFFQPSELAKITLIMFLAYLMDKYKKTRHKVKSFWAFLAIAAFYALMIFAESHLSGAILFACIGYSMMWFNGMNKKCFYLITAIVVLGALVVAWKPEMFSFAIHDYQIDRIVIWKKILFNRDLTYNEKINNARQVLQSLYGIGSGGLTGVGFGNSGQKINNLQEKANDFIFAVLGEEWGFLGSMIMLIFYGFLVGLGFNIALKTKSNYGMLVALGISTQMALQVLINVAVATSLLPNTGISLPFFSDGGSSLLMTLASMGIMLAISKDDGRVKKNVRKQVQQ